MFDNPLLERLSRVHPVVPPLIYLPVIAFCLVRAVGAQDLPVAAVAGVFVLGLAGWSLTEYLLHRFVFHFEPDNALGPAPALHHPRRAPRLSARPDAARDAAVGQRAAGDPVLLRVPRACSARSGRCRRSPASCSAT